MASLKNLSELFFFRTLSHFASIFPRSWCLAWGRALGLLFYYLDKKHRQITLTNLRTAFGKDLPSDSLTGISRRCFIDFGQVIMDIIKFPSLSQEEKNRIVDIEGQNHLEEALGKSKGALLFSGHYGNWEIASYYLSKFARLSAIYRPLDNPLLEKELYKLRTSLGTEVTSKHRAAKHILHSLRQKKMVALLIDQNVLRSQAVFVDFFAKKAATTPSLAAFYLRTQAPLVPVFCFPTSSHKYCLKIHKPLEFSLSGDTSQDVLKITQICTKIIEIQVRQNPDYWFWFHRRWKTRPEGEEDEALGVKH